MAWRIDNCVVRGELDNRTRGVVRARLWLHGGNSPVALELIGNACADLAGCLLEFENREPTIAVPRELRLSPPLRGAAGDLTASRRVRLAETDANGRPKATERWGNALYLEWFTPGLGRIVIESTDFTLRISAPEWALTPAEEQARRQAAEEAFAGFLSALDAAVRQAEAQTPPADKEDWDEFDYERLLRESDARTDKYSELLDRYLEHPDRDAIVARLMGWTAEEAKANAEELDTEDDDDDTPPSVEELNAAAAEALENPIDPDPATEGVDWVREEDGNLSHPLSLRTFNSSMALWRSARAAGMDQSADEDLAELVSEFQITGAKLSGALDSLAYGRSLERGPFIVAYLKRALSHLHRAQAALERVALRSLLLSSTVERTRQELFEIREEILRLMQEFRGGTK